MYFALTAQHSQYSD